MSVRLRWLVVLATALTVAAQLALAAVVVDLTRPRLPDLATVEPLLDKGIGDVVAAAGDRAAVAVDGVVGYTSCQDTVLARGSRFNRGLDLYTDPGTEGTLIGTVLAGLPAADHARRTGATALTADLGDGVTVRLSQLGDGWLEAFAETGCRTGTPPPQRPATDGTASSLLVGLGTAVDSAHADTVSCAGHPVTTVSAISRTTDSAHLPARLAPLVPTGAHRFDSTANRLAWRDPTGSTVVAASDDGAHITVQHTTPC